MTALISTRSPPRTPLDAASSMNTNGKRTFKDKLHGMIQEAEAAEIAAQREQQLQDKKSLAISLLLEGRPAAFVDFFHLTHGNPFKALTSESTPGGGSSAHQPSQSSSPASSEESGKLPNDILGLLKQQLVLADVASRSGAPKEVYTAYKVLHGSIVPVHAHLG